MNPDVIARYFGVLRSIPRRVMFYCCNRVEKVLPDGTVVRFQDYPWSAQDAVQDDGLCPWTQQYYSWRAPFVHRFDGQVRHRLVALAGASGAGFA